MKLFITAIGTDSGKTLASSIFCQALKADYWKPIQTGTSHIDAETVKEYVSFPVVIHPETYHLKAPLSPHQAAIMEDKRIVLKDFQLPKTKNHLIVEGAGGVLVPINEKGDYVIDIAQKLHLEVVLVIRLYLGCINHAMLTINELQRRNVPIKGIVFNGADMYGAVSYISNAADIPVLLHINEEPDFTKDIIRYYSLFLSRLT